MIIGTMILDFAHPIDGRKHDGDLREKGCLTTQESLSPDFHQVVRMYLCDDGSFRYECGRIERVGEITGGTGGW
jgi:hypothetical protein